MAGLAGLGGLPLCLAAQPAQDLSWESCLCSMQSHHPGCGGLRVAREEHPVCMCFLKILLGIFASCLLAKGRHQEGTQLENLTASPGGRGCTITVQSGPRPDGRNGGHLSVSSTRRSTFSEEAEPSRNAPSTQDPGGPLSQGVNCFRPPVDKTGLLLPLPFRLFCSAVSLDLLPHDVAYTSSLQADRCVATGIGGPLSQGALLPSSSL